jgi:hypothetical protein
MTLSDAWSGLAWVPDRRPIWEWAADNVTLPPVLSRPGRFDWRGSRHFIGPLEALQSDRVREVNIMAPVRSAKTLLADLWVPWVRANDPGSVLWVFQDDAMAKSHAETRAMPTLLSVDSIRPMLPANRHKLRKGSIVFADGLPLYLQGPAIGGLQSRGFRYVIADEPWLYKPGILSQAKARMGDFVRLQNNKLLAISQGGVEDDDWDTQYKTGTINEWCVGCVACGHKMLPKWTGHRQDGSRWGMVWDGDKDGSGNYDIRRAVATARFVCESCGHEHRDEMATKAAWNESGEWEMTVDNGESRQSFHWTAIIDYPWSELVTDWLQARRAASFGNHEPTIQFCQKRLAEPKSEKTAHVGMQPFARIGDAEKWEDGCIRFLTADRQSEDVYWATVREWEVETHDGMVQGTGRSRRIWFGRLYSEADIEAKRVEFKVLANRTFIDSGYRPKGDQGVYAACARYGWVALKGADDPYFWHHVKAGGRVDRVQKPYAQLTWGDPGEGTSKQGRRRAPLIRFSAPTLADRLAELIAKGMFLEPEDTGDPMEAEYQIQMAAEFKKVKHNKFTGKEELVWVCPSKNNHAFDCGKMQVCAAILAKLI